jgi:sRNA-binding protein
MSKDKPTLTLNFNQSNEDANAARELMLERIKRLSGNIILPSKNDLTAKDASATVPTTVKTTKAKPVTQESPKKSSTNKIDKKKENKEYAAATEVKDTNRDKQYYSTPPKTNKDKIALMPRSHKISPDLVKNMNLYFQETFPLCFTNPISPLALGIHLQLRAHKQQFPDSLCTSNNVFKYLYVYTRNMQYKKALVAGANRLNIDGSIAGVVTEEEAQRAIDDQIKYEQIKQAKLTQKIAQYHDIKIKKDKKDKLKDVEKESEPADIADVIVDENNKIENIEDKIATVTDATSINKIIETDEKVQKPKKSKKLDAVEHYNSN